MPWRECLDLWVVKQMKVFGALASSSGPDPFAINPQKAAGPRVACYLMRTWPVINKANMY